MPYRIRRAYDPPEPEDGRRVLVDRLWPRGLSKEAAELDDWLRGIAPSAELRRWYGHRPELHEEFAERYVAELADPEHAEALDRLRDLARSAGSRTPVTLLTATKDPGLSHLPLLVEHLRGKR